MLGYWDEPEKIGTPSKTVDAYRRPRVLDDAVICRSLYNQGCGHSGRRNLFPREIEEYLFRHPAVADVQVFGVPDKKYGEELCAWIVRNPVARRSRRISAGFAKGRFPIKRFRATGVSSMPSRSLRLARQGRAR